MLRIRLSVPRKRLCSVANIHGLSPEQIALIAVDAYLQSSTSLQHETNSRYYERQADSELKKAARAAIAEEGIPVS